MAKSTSGKKAAAKSKDEPLSNGHADSETEHNENATELKTHESKKIKKLLPVNTELSVLGEEIGNTLEVEERNVDIDEEQEQPQIDKVFLPEDLEATVSKEKESVIPDVPKIIQKAGHKRKTPAVPKGEKKVSKIESKTQKSGISVMQERNKDAEQQESEDAPVNLKTATKNSNRKRKPAPEKIEMIEEIKAAPKTKAKRQKVLFEVPKINSIPGKVFVIGENDVGQLGLGEDIPQKTRPALLDLPYSIVDIAAGGMHSVCLTESGEVITFGCNDEGALGRVTSEEGTEYIPGRVDIPERIVQLSAGDSHTAALSDSGQVYIWGNFRNGNGPMGLVSDGSFQSSPVRILNDIKVVKIASGSDHLVCLSHEGTIYTCGCGDSGQLGRVSQRYSVDGGRIGRKILLTPDKVLITRSSKTLRINNIWTGSYATFANVRESGSIYAFGLNNYNQLGLQNDEDITTYMKPKQVTSFNGKHWQQIVGGQHHTMALDDRGLVHSLGRHDYGRLGLGENSGHIEVPTEIPTLQDEKCLDISCGNIVSFAVTDKGSVFSWGMGTNSQLGHGNDDDQHTPRQVGGNFLNSWKALKVSGGGQHTLILATPRGSSKNTQ